MAPTIDEQAPAGMTGGGKLKTVARGDLDPGGASCLGTSMRSIFRNTRQEPYQTGYRRFERFGSHSRGQLSLCKIGSHSLLCR